MDAQTAIEAAMTWRTANPQHMLTGVVLVWNGEVYGWKDRLRDPQHERPGVLAVDVRGHVWQAIGGTYQCGAKAWDEIEFPEQWGRA